MRYQTSIQIQQKLTFTMVHANPRCETSFQPQRKFSKLSNVHKNSKPGVGVGMGVVVVGGGVPTSASLGTKEHSSSTISSTESTAIIPVPSSSDELV